MALTTPKAGDYLNLGYNIEPCFPKSGYTPVKGNLVIRAATVTNGVDVCADGEEPFGLVMTVGPGTIPAVCGVAVFVPGVHVTLPTAVAGTPAALALGDRIQADDGGMTAVGTTGMTRTRVEADEGGVGTVISVDTVNFTAVVEF